MPYSEQNFFPKFSFIRSNLKCVHFKILKDGFFWCKFCRSLVCVSVFKSRDKKKKDFEIDSKILLKIYYPFRFALQKTQKVILKLTYDHVHFVSIS